MHAQALHSQKPMPALALNVSPVGWPKALEGVAGNLYGQRVRPGQGVPSACLPQHDILRSLRLRQTRWLNVSYTLKHNLWQRAIDDKLLGYVFARSIGVPTPSVLFCDDRGPSSLPDVWPKSWGCCFVIKPLCARGSNKNLAFLPAPARIAAHSACFVSSCDCLRWVQRFWRHAR